MDRNPIDGGVIAVYWKCEAFNTETGRKWQIYDNIRLNPDPTSPTFIDFNSLTKDIVLNWVWDTVNKQAIEENIRVETEMVRHSELSPGLPW